MPTESKGQKPPPIAAELGVIPRCGLEKVSHRRKTEGRLTGPFVQGKQGGAPQVPREGGNSGSVSSVNPGKLNRSLFPTRVRIRWDTFNRWPARSALV